jgi:hypothetical protein
MAFPSNVSGGFNFGTQMLTISGRPSNALEIGTPFGPSMIGGQYGVNGTLGGAFAATLSVTGVVVGTNGIVSNNGSLTITYNGGIAGSIGSDYGIVAGDPLLLGTVREVVLDATGDNTLDVFVDVSGGALQNDNPHPDVGVFAPSGQAILRIAGVAMPSTWSEGFSLNKATIDVLGLPNPPDGFNGKAAVSEFDAADLNADRTVDAADYVVWRKNVDAVAPGAGWGASFATSNAADDLNADGTVDASDYVVWRKTAVAATPVAWGASFGMSTSAADLNGDGNVGAADYVVLQKDGLSGTQATTAPVPEPFVWQLILSLGALLALVRTPR